MAPRQRQKQTGKERACMHCGGLVMDDTRKCPQCGKFPVKLHKCVRCGCIADQNAHRCWHCGRMYEPGSDYL